MVDALHRWEVAADDTLHCLYHPLEGLTISSGAAVVPGSPTASGNALSGAPVEVGEVFGRHARLLESPQGVEMLLGSFYCQVQLPGPGDVIIDEHRILSLGMSLLGSSGLNTEV